MRVVAPFTAAAIAELFPVPGVPLSTSKYFQIGYVFIQQCFLK